MASYPVQVVIVGPAASGKTTIAHEIARHLSRVGFSVKLEIEGSDESKPTISDEDLDERTSKLLENKTIEVTLHERQVQRTSKLG